MAKGKRKAASGDVATNRQARFRYELLERLEAGIVLLGTEVKALRTGGAQMRDSYATLTDGELWLHNLHIPPYAPAAREKHKPTPPREPPPRPLAQAAAAPPRDRPPRRAHPRARADRRADAHLLQGLPRQG